MHGYTTPRTLNDALRVGRLTLPQWGALVLGALSLWLWSGVAAPVRDINLHIMVATVPTVLLVVPVLAFFRGGIERYPQQVVRYARRSTCKTLGRAALLAYTAARKGVRHAQARRAR